jgi:hypothetical protein
MTTPQANPEALLWWPRFEAGLDHLLHPGRWLASPPPGVPLEQLLAALKLLGVSSGQADPAHEAAQLIKGRTANLRELLADLAAEVAAALIAAVAEANGEAAGEEEVIRPAAFGRLVFLPAPAGSAGNPTLRDALLVAGVLDSLPADSPLRTACPDPLLFGLVRAEGPPDGNKLTVKYEAGTAVLALGPSGPLTGTPRPWYDRPSALALTAALRARQVEEDTAFLDKLRIERLEEQNRFWTSPEGVAEARRRATAWKIKLGRVPPAPKDVPPDPAEVPAGAVTGGR